MKYKKVNEELRIFSCELSDLTSEQAAHFLRSWEDGATLGMLSLFYDPEEDALVLNRSNKKYREYLEMAEFVLSANEEELDIFEKYLPDSIKETFYVIKNCKRKRRTKKEIQIIQQQEIICSGTPEAEILEELSRNNSDIVLLSLAYKYGFIQGKRAERKKSRHLQKTGGAARKGSRYVDYCTESNNESAGMGNYSARSSK